MKIFANSRILVKLLWMVVPIAFALIYITITLFYQIEKVNQEAKSVYLDVLYSNTKLLLTSDRDIFEASLAERTLADSGTLMSEDQKNEYLNTYNNACTELAQNVDTVIKSIYNDKYLFQEFTEKTSDKSMDKLNSQFADQFTSWKNTYDPNTGTGYINVKNAQFKEMRQTLNLMCSLLAQYSDQSQTKMDIYVNSLRLKMLILVGVSFLLMFLVCSYVVHYVVTNLEAVTRNMKKLADKNLNIQIKNNLNTDELGRLSKTMGMLVMGLRKVMESVLHVCQKLAGNSMKMQNASDQVASSMLMVSRSMCEISAGATTQVRETEILIREVENLGEIVLESKKSTGLLSEATHQILENSMSGLKIVDDLSSINQKNREEFTDLFQSINAADKNAGKIIDLISLISDIAEQVNLISLNAAIEASRAGLAGKGFSVIAAEINKLSVQTQKSTDQIEAVLNNISSDINISTERCKKAEATMQNQTNCISDTREQYSSIIAQLDHVTNEISSLENISEVIDRSRGRISDIMENVSAVSMQFEENTKLTSEASEEILSIIGRVREMGVEINQSAVELKSMIQEFTTSQ